MATYQFAQIKAPPAKAPASKAPAGKTAPAKKPASSSASSSSDFNKKHPRGAVGGGKGGQFVALSYDSGSNTGTGYGSKQGDGRVKQAQQALNRLGIKDKNGKPLVIDGKYGPLTTSAVAAWQKKNGIKPANGKLTPALIKQLTGGKKPAGTHKKSHLAKGKKKLKPAAKTKTKPPPPRKLMPWERAHQPPPANYRPNPAEPR